MKDKTGADILLNTVYKAFDDIAGYYNGRKTMIHGEIASTDNITKSESTCKHKKPPGSPSNVATNKSSKISKEGMERVEESIV